MFKIKLIAISIAFLFSSVAFAGGEESVGTCNNKQIKSFMTLKYSQYNIVEFVDITSDNGNFVKKSFGKQYLDNHNFINKCEFQVNNTLGEKMFHIGYVEISYGGKTLPATNHLKLKEGYLNGTKILTKYRSTILGQKLKIWYSETFLDDLAKDFLSDIK